MPRVVRDFEHLPDFFGLFVDGKVVGHTGLWVVILQGNFIEFEASVSGSLQGASFEATHFRRGHRLKVLCDFQVLPQDLGESIPVMVVATGRLIA